MNNFELMGKLNWSEIKFIDSGKVLTRALLGVKRGQDDWQSYPITIFNTKTKKTAEEFAEVKKGTYVKVTGKLDLNTWTDKVTQKELSRIELIGFDFVEMTFDENQKRFVEKTKENCVDNERYSTVEKTVYEPEIISDEEIAF